MKPKMIRIDVRLLKDLVAESQSRQEVIRVVKKAIGADNFNQMLLFDGNVTEQLTDFTERVAEFLKG